MTRSRRTVVIGDVHGCFDELQDLLRAAAVRPEDRLISVGDLVCKGPDSLAVLEWAMRTPNLECVVGNHELRLLRHWRAGTRSTAKSYDAETYRQLGDSYVRCMEYIATWPFTRSGPGFLVVHAGLDPREDLEWQSQARLTSVKRLEDGRPWYQHYRARPLLVYGHWARHSPVVRSNAIGLDTGCVYGNALTALILPERRLVSVPARRAYAAKPVWDESEAAR